MNDLVTTLILTLDISREEAQQLAQFVEEDPDPWQDEYETF